MDMRLLFVVARGNRADWITQNVGDMAAVGQRRVGSMIYIRYALTVNRNGQRASTDAGLWMFSSSMGIVGLKEYQLHNLPCHAQSR